MYISKSLTTSYYSCCYYSEYILTSCILTPIENGLKRIKRHPGRTRIERKGKEKRHQNCYCHAHRRSLFAAAGDIELPQLFFSLPLSLNSIYGMDIKLLSSQSSSHGSIAIFNSTFEKPKKSFSFFFKWGQSISRDIQSTSKPHMGGWIEGVKVCFFSFFFFTMFSRSLRLRSRPSAFTMFDPRCVSSIHPSFIQFVVSS